MDWSFLNKAWIATALLVVLYALESVAPMYSGRVGRVRHGLINLGLGWINSFAVALPATSMLYVVTEWARLADFGLTRWLGMPTWMSWIFVLAAFDAWMYWWHRFNHRISWLWRFHAVHHSDREMDVTSALRFHPGEILFSSLARMVVLPALGMTMPQLLAYETLLLPVILFHHSNVWVPRALDAGLRLLIVTPWMHWVHHSQNRCETNSNYSSVFSFWDRLFGSYRLRPDPEAILQGLPDEDGGADWRTPRDLLSAPFRHPRGRLDNGECDIS
ncbi:MAG: sterol desaturase family protein [Thermogutta sp.]